MPSLKDLKNRIGSVKNTRKITKAMQLVAAAKLRRAQDVAEAARPYAERMSAIIAGLALGVEGADDAPRLLVGTGKKDVHLLVVMTAERGLCGAFNSSIVRLLRRNAKELIAAGKTVKILTVGRKGREQLSREFSQHFVGHVDLSGLKRVGYTNAQDITRDILRRFDADEFDVAAIFFSRFHSVVSQVPTAQQIIPAQFDKSDDVFTMAQYDYEPSEQEILSDLLPKGVTTQVFAALLENSASEQGARMSAMDNATRNAGDMINKLTIQYNRSRQAAITKELIEIISGAEAL